MPIQILERLASAAYFGVMESVLKVIVIRRQTVRNKDRVEKGRILMHRFYNIISFCVLFMTVLLNSCATADNRDDGIADRSGAGEGA